MYDALSHFNIGDKATILIYQKLGMTCDINTLRGLSEGNLTRIKNEIVKVLKLPKQNVALIEGQRREKRTNATKEGKTYIPGRF